MGIHIFLQDWKMNALLGKKIKLVFADFEKILVKTGIVEAADFVFISIKTERGMEFIPTTRVVRIEVINEDAED